MIKRKKGKEKRKKTHTPALIIKVCYLEMLVSCFEKTMLTSAPGKYVSNGFQNLFLATR